MFLIESYSLRHFSYFQHTAGCRSDQECPLTQACIQRECQDPCPFEQCGIKAKCLVSNHLARCQCPPGHDGSPYVECKPYECLRDPDCPTTLTCRDKKCVDPCDCAVNADCEARNHRGICTCRPGYTGDPYFEGCRLSKIHFTYSMKLYFFNTNHFILKFLNQLFKRKKTAESIPIVQPKKFVTNLEEGIVVLTHAQQFLHVLPMQHVKCIQQLQLVP